MLKNIDPILGPDLLATLRAMGHGSEIAIVDGNYPAQEHGQRVLRMDGVPLIAIIDAILSVLPVDDFVDEALFRPANTKDPEGLEPVHKEMLALCEKFAPDRKLIPLKGDAFYDRVKSAYAVVATTEPRFYGNMIIRKGVIYPHG
ncbi:RbsD/FucU domain-containing protein [Labrenzia sp. DG1229]|uniref:RbsD/FucU family protein n=1 Tax=Labrenzia sp. DG1229 TaxID=681847 RepID=UPI000491E3C7|nr:RbsD/FucU domain-containing protein [Labrenzia sp. DG1229]